MEDLLNDTLIENLGIEIVSLDKNEIIMTMPVDKRTRQPYGFLHGGASVALAETVASMGAAMNVDLNECNVFGIEINANHIKSKREGIVTAKGKPIHSGKTTAVWEVRLTDEEDALICISRCTIGIVSKKK
ncbi:hotdog fold thioesterase [Oceanobacillus caeni]|uniref:Esterase n=1 Tax=Oceanobacillus caeni TaxID=405946 RepID=A0ABR5MHV6_9BACI|nr:MULTISPECIES: hotdog fold thioesterase [Bacillaceae]KKE79519.1 esterase [Bacilli bacterium VT-13-104]PZD89772.1 hotdog fold thioesterase [Bacilli bacterium]KPH73805.1 esterase [Oceanobacillus caeni]MBU8791837.1 hotdog fold thioesterase [Oceanobacillus caeni]MCR1836031.1 hotdog fold thioesterase [Oceanobacillus caeni]